MMVAKNINIKSSTGKNARPVASARRGSECNYSQRDFCKNFTFSREVRENE